MMKVNILILFLISYVSIDVLAFAPITKIPLTAKSVVSSQPQQPSTLQSKRESMHQLLMDAQNDDGRPDPSILISAKDDKTQQLAFVSAFVALAAGTSVCINLWNGPGAALTDASLGFNGFDNLRSTIFPITFGIIFAVVGVLHFVAKDNFVKIVPPKGSWGGLWQAPSPFSEQLGVTYEEYHTYWTGIAEFIGGIWLLAGGLHFTDTQVPAALLFLLTVGVTPANLYMFTHDANPGDNVPRLSYPAGHIARFVVQCGLLSNFAIMATYSN
jgi:uncharacterized membrane protein